MTELTPKQAGFCREYIKDCCGTQAAIRAGYSERTANEQASRLLAKVHVRTEIDRLQAEIAAASHVTVQTLLKEAEEARGLAIAQKQASAAVAATTLKAKLTGNLIERTEDLVARDKLEADKERAELRTAANWLAEAAASVGLPQDATPLQIIGASAERVVMPPEVYTLLHFSAVDREKARKIEN